MEIENPYQPPEGDGLAEIASGNKSQQPVYDTRWQATRAGIWRGAVLGLKISSPVSAVLIAGILLLIIVRTTKQAEYIFSDYEFFLIYAVATAKLFGMIVLFGIFIVLICVIPGGLLMGLIESLLYRNPK
ncbi:MAG: hypothetical protein JXM70_02180 [Pirellulales bacterium]|nr:hypothetical protein [Pirellulales bacterium]